ncbi:MAG: hypothetical protein JNK64_29350 [Myxococcales bacterium]|nr:hypothetical protein [Myxococcales bacterium]
MRASILVPLVVAATAATAATTTTARADGLVELAVGGGLPLAEDDYADTVDNSAKFAVHAASVGERGVGVDLGLDVTPVSLDNAQFFGLEASAWRFRGLVGARGQWPLGAKGVGFVRGGAGVDLARYAVTGTLLGQSVDTSETDVGLALEVGGGVGVRLGGAIVSAQLALPIALHFDDDDPADPDDFDFEYTGIDLDVLFAVGTTM